MSDSVTADIYCHHTTAQAHARVVDQAAAVLTEWFDLSHGEAGTLMSRCADEHDVSVCRLAEALVQGVYLGRPTGCSTLLVRQVEAWLRRLPLMPPDSSPSSLDLSTGA